MPGRIDLSGARRKLARAGRIIDRTSVRAVNDLLQLGKDYAKALAPRDTGRTASFIKVFKITQQGELGKVQAQNPTVGMSHRRFPGMGNYVARQQLSGRYAGGFNLVRWMHETGGVFQSRNPYGKPGKQHIRSGDPTFMYTTTEFLRDAGVKGVRKHYRNIKIR